MTMRRVGLAHMVQEVERRILARARVTYGHEAVISMRGKYDTGVRRSATPTFPGCPERDLPVSDASVRRRCRVYELVVRNRPADGNSARPRRRAGPVSDPALPRH